MSIGERVAWEALRQLRSEGIHVIRQHQIGRSTVDFAIRKRRIAIEIDGGVHDLPGRAEYDAARQQHLENIGWRVLRFRAEKLNTDDLLRAVRAAAPPLPSKGGGGGQDEAQEFAAPDAPFSKRLQRRTRENRVLPPRSKAVHIGASPHPLTPSSQEEGE